jgi:hypothetical protein
VFREPCAPGNLSVSQRVWLTELRSIPRPRGMTSPSQSKGPSRRKPFYAQCIVPPGKYFTGLALGDDCG